MPTDGRTRTRADEILSPALAGGRTGDADWSATDLESLLVDAVAHELGRRYGGNAVLNRLEAAALLARHAALESPSATRAPREAPPRPDFPSIPTSRNEQDIHR